MIGRIGHYHGFWKDSSEIGAAGGGGQHFESQIEERGTAKMHVASTIKRSNRNRNQGKPRKQRVRMKSVKKKKKKGLVIHCVNKVAVNGKTGGYAL